MLQYKVNWKLKMNLYNTEKTNNQAQNNILYSHLVWIRIKGGIKQYTHLNPFMKI